MTRLLYKYLFVLLITVLSVSTAKAETKDQHTGVLLRAIGHEFLLQIGDSKSRILEIEKIDGRYAMKFEHSFSYEPDLLFFAAFKIFKEYNVGESYIVEVEECTTKAVIHSFKASLNTQDSMTPCGMRESPANCYVFYFTLIEEKVERSFENSNLSDGFDYSYFTIIILAVVFVSIYLMRLKRESKSSSIIINIGKYQFDQKRMLLIIKSEFTELSSKESDLLFLFYSNENKTLKREYILNEVWGDTGNYVGRTLDVFVSKLRKKLEADETLKIINVRGVGYRFVMN